MYFVMQACEVSRETPISIVHTLFSDLVEGRVAVDEYAAGYVRAKLFSVCNHADEHQTQWSDFVVTAFFRDDAMRILTYLQNRQSGECCRFLARIALKRLRDEGYAAVFCDDGVRATVRIGREDFDVFDMWNTYITGRQAPPVASDHAIEIEM